MPQQLLNGAQVSSFFQQMGSEGVAQGVGVNVFRQPVLEHNLFKNAADAASCQPHLAQCAARDTSGSARLLIDEECRLARLPRGSESCSAFRQIAAKCLGSGFTEWNV